MSTQASIEERVKKIVREQMATYGAKEDALHGAHHLTNDLGFDSLDLVEATIGVEDEFGIEIDDEVMWETETVQQFIDHVTAKVKA